MFLMTWQFKYWQSSLCPFDMRKSPSLRCVFSADTVNLNLQYEYGNRLLLIFVPKILTLNSRTQMFTFLCNLNYPFLKINRNFGLKDLVVFGIFGSTDVSIGWQINLSCTLKDFQYTPFSQEVGNKKKCYQE